MSAWSCSIFRAVVGLLRLLYTQLNRCLIHHSDMVVVLGYILEIIKFHAFLHTLRPCWCSTCTVQLEPVDFGPIPPPLMLYVRLLSRLSVLFFYVRRLTPATGTPRVRLHAPIP